MENIYFNYIYHLSLNIPFEKQKEMSFTICDPEWNIIWENVPFDDAYDLLEAHSQLKCYCSDINPKYFPK